MIRSYIHKLLIAVIIIANLFSYGHASERYAFERDCPLSINLGITANYGEHRSTPGYSNHDGLDYRAAKGRRVYPVAGGTAKIGESAGWGKYVIVASNTGGKYYETRYAHLNQILVSNGGLVTKDTLLGYSGDTGNSNGPHLHFSFGPSVLPANTKNPIISGLKQQYYGDAEIAPIDSKQQVASSKIEDCIIFYDENAKKRLNNSVVGKKLMIIAEAYHELEITKYKTNPYKISFTIRKKGEPGYILTKHPEIIFKDLKFNQNDYYCFTEPFRTVSTRHKYNEYYYMDWIPTDPGAYEVEVKAYVAYWDGDNLIAPTTANPDLGLTDVRTREIIISDDYLYSMVDPTGMYAWEPPAAAASAAGIKAADLGWPMPKYANDLSNTTFTTNWVEVDPDFQKYTEFTYSAMRNSDFTVRIKDQSGNIRHNLYASGTEGEIKWDGSGVAEGTYGYEIEAKDPLTGIVSTKEGISLVTIDNTKPRILATAFPNKTSITQSEESTSIQFYPDEDLTSCMVNVVDATSQSKYIIEGLGKYPRLRANEVVNLTWDGAGYFGDGSYQFEVVMTDLAGNINKRYSNPITVNISGTYIPPSLGESELPPPPYGERARVTDFAYDASGNKYVLYGRQGRVFKYNSAGEKTGEDDQKISLSYPQGIAVSPTSGRVYVADTHNNRIVVYGGNLKYSIAVSAGVIHYRRDWNKSQLFPPEGSLYKPTDIKIAPDDQVYVVDSANNRLLRFKEQYPYIVAGDIFEGIPFQVAFKTVDGDKIFGTTYSSGINDSFNWHLVYNSSFKAQCDNYGNDNGQFTSPESAAVDPSGNIFVADTGNNRIQKFDPDGSFASKFGEGILRSPRGIDIDAHGNIWAADAGNVKTANVG